MPNIILEGKKVKLTVLEHLKERGEIKNTLEARLNDTLKANLSIHLREQLESRLAELITEIAPRDLNAIKDLTLKELVEQTIEAKIGDDEDLQNVYEEFLETLTDETRINDLLYLDQPLEKNPLFEDIVKDSQLHQLLQLTPLKNKPDKTDAFLSALDQSGGLHDGFWEILEKDKVASNKEIEDIKLTFELSALALDNLELVKALKERNIKAKEDLIPFRKEEWLHIFEEHNITPPDSFEDENRLEAYANYLSDYIADESPTAVFFNRLLSDNVDEYIEDLICVKEFLRLNPDVALETEISYEKVIWPSDDPQERENIKQSIENLRKLFKLYSQLGLERIINNAEIEPEAKMQEINDEIAKLGIFYQNNPRLDLHYADFYNGYATTQVETGDEMPEISWDGLEERDKDKLTNQLKVYQRLFRIRPRFKTTKTLLKNDFDSARNITLIPKEQFVAKYADLLSNPDTTIAEQVYDKALAITENTTLQWANVKDAIASPYYTGTFFNNVDDTLKKEYQSLRSYQDMFGSLNFCECEHCKSIFGPAAYFVDLMRFIDLHITEKNPNIPADWELKSRRSDLWEIPLDCKNTNTLISYLDIVNKVLEDNLRGSSSNKDEPYETLLLKASHPFDLPFNLPLEQIRIYLGHFNKDLYEIFEAFGVSEIDVATEYLQISQEELSVITTSTTDTNKLASIYGISSSSLLSSASGGLARVKTFLYHTGLSRKQLNELFFQNLDKNEKNSDVQQTFFINNVNDGKSSLNIKMDAADLKKRFEKIINLSEKKLDRIHRFIRLSEKLGWTYEELDWVLKSINKSGPGKNIDKDAIIRMARIKKWQKMYSLSLDVLCCFWYNIKNIGKKNPKGYYPQDLFNRLFNQPDVRKDKYEPPPFETLDLYKASDKNRNWLLAALEIYDEDLILIVGELTNPTNPKLPKPIQLNQDNLSRLYRFSKIPSLLGLTVKEFNFLLKLMKAEGLINKNEITSIADFEQIAKLADWISSSGLSIYELDYILTENVNQYVDPGYSETDIRLFIDELSKEFKNAIIKESTFQAIEGIDEDQSTKIFTELKNKKFLKDVEIGSRLTDKFTPNASGFSLKLSAQVKTFENQVISLLKKYLKTDTIFKSVFLSISGVDKQQAETIYNDLKTNKILQAVIITGRLTDKFKPDTPNFSLGLPAPLNNFESQIISILKRYSEEKIALEKLAVFFSTEPSLLNSVINFISSTFASQTLRNKTFLELLSRPLAKQETIPTEISNSLCKIHARLFLVTKLKLKKSEIDSITAKPKDYYGISDISAIKIYDIKKLDDFKGLTKAFNDTQDKLINYFKVAVKKDDSATRRKKAIVLGKLTNWEKIDDTAESWKNSYLKLLFEKFWPTQTLAGQNPGYNSVAGVLKIKKCVDLSTYLGVGINILLETWLKIPDGKWENYTNAAKSVLEILKAKYSESEWKKKIEPLKDNVRELKRDALSSYAIWNIDKNWTGGLAIKNLRDLYEYLLIDVEMTSCATISKIKEGISSLQLYMHRCQMSLEPGVKPESIPQKQ